MRFVIVTACCALLSWACASEEEVARGALVVEAAPLSAAADLTAPKAPPARSRARGEGSAGTARAVAPTKPDEGLRGVSAEFPWGNADGGPWMGTGSPDPEPLKKISDEEMMRLAMDTKDAGLDRQHALVSIGRRHLPGAIEAFRAALAPDQDRAIREMALSGLMEHGRSEALPVMWEVLREDVSPQLRGMAVWAVALYGPDEARRAIDHGLADEALMVRNMATLAIWALKDRPEEALDLLQGAIDADEQMIYQEGFYNLSRMPYPEAARMLEKAVQGTKDEAKRHRAIIAYRTWIRNFPDLK